MISSSNHSPATRLVHVNWSLPHFCQWCLLLSEM